jgi:dipeptidyl aminopeptidase/acylaminoacyl peptidase
MKSQTAISTLLIALISFVSPALADPQEWTIGQPLNHLSGPPVKPLGLSFDFLCAINTNAMASISPDGKNLAYLFCSPAKLARPTIWLRNLTSGKDEALVPDCQANTLYWQDDKHLLYLNDFDKHLWQVDLSTKQKRDLTPLEGAMVIDFSYTNKCMLVVIKLKGHKAADLYLLNPENGALTPAMANTGRIPEDVSCGWMYDAAFCIRAIAEEQDDGTSILKLRNNAHGKWKEIDKGARFHSMGFNKDYFYYLKYPESGTNQLVRYNLKSGKKDCVAQEKDVDIEHVYFLNDAPAAISMIRDKREWQTFDKTFADDLTFLKSKLHGSIEVGNADQKREKLVIREETDQRPQLTYIFNRKDRSLTLISKGREQTASKYRFPSMKCVSLDSRDGLKLHGYLTLPLNTTGKNLPFIVLVHGGPSARDKWGFDSLTLWLATRGYGVLQVNYRGSTGYGEDFRRLARRQWGRKMNDDILDAKNWAVSNGYADPARIAIMGASYGGFATLAALAYSPQEFTCGVDLCGPSDIKALLDEKLESDIIFKGKLHAEFADPEAKEFSPLFAAQRITKPVLIAHSIGDDVVKYHHSKQMVEELLKADKHCHFIKVDSTDHSPLGAQLMPKLEAFLDTHLRGCQENAKNSLDH